MPWDPVQLSDGNVMPSIAYGTWRTGKGQQPVDSLNQAFTAGIRHVDTAQNYRNEPEAGMAIRSCGLPRESIFVTTKWSRLDGLDIATSFKNSLKNLDLTYIDLYLIHGAELCDEDGIEKCWEEMEKIKESGLAKSIGVSNFEVPDLEKVFAMAKHVPVVNQILLHPYVYSQQLSIIELCKEKGIIVEAYSPLIPVTKHPGGPVDKPVGAIAKRLGVSMDQVLLAWAKEKGTVPVTMSQNKKRLDGYISAGSLTLSSQDMKLIDEAAKEGV
ncbi:Aldo/keto reductase [Pholiota conissans]|uniref:Aldo/keto reductase n=1 Tax=Pholiota conissans TaxID=109636 RepID=A0A9P5Z2W9_9AGAR|nr:Aldo/keto reductase [Pholiota conissans]